MAENLKTSFPDPAAMTRAKKLGLVARQLVEGRGSGMHRGSFKGYARGFSGHREYLPGDELGQMDWRATARRGKPFLKQYAADSDRAVHLVIDGSESMAYASAERSKFDFARNLAACLAYLALLQEDSVQLSLFGEKLRERTSVVNRVEGFSGLMEKLAAWEPSGETRISGSISGLAERLRRGGLVILLSDFFEETETWMEAVERLRFQGNEVLLCQVLDGAEIEFPFAEVLEFEGLEGKEKLIADGAQVRKFYCEELERFLGRMREGCARSGSHWILADSSKSLSEVLESYLAFRRQARRL